MPIVSENRFSVLLATQTFFSLLVMKDNSFLRTMELLARAKERKLGTSFSSPLELSDCWALTVGQTWASSEGVNIRNSLRAARQRTCVLVGLMSTYTSASSNSVQRRAAANLHVVLLRLPSAPEMAPGSPCWAPTLEAGQALQMPAPSQTTSVCWSPEKGAEKGAWGLWLNPAAHHWLGSPEDCWSYYTLIMKFSLTNQGQGEK